MSLMSAYPCLSPPARLVRISTQGSANLPRPSTRAPWSFVARCIVSRNIRGSSAAEQDSTPGTGGPAAPWQACLRGEHCRLRTRPDELVPVAGADVWRWGMDRRIVDLDRRAGRPEPHVPHEVGPTRGSARRSTGPGPALAHRG